MSWQDALARRAPTWADIEAYAAHRTAELTAVCVDPAQTDAAIRHAQAGLAELAHLLAQPKQLAMQALAQGNKPKTEY